MSQYSVSQYRAETELERIDEHRFTGQVSDAWNIGENPNGGYLLSLVLRALDQVLPHPDPLSVTTHYLRPGVGNAPCEIEVDVIRGGRTLSTARARLMQEGKARLEVITSFSDLDVPSGTDQEIDLPRPELPPLEDCVPRSGAAQGLQLAINERLDVMLHPDFAHPGSSERAQISGYIRLSDGTEPDTRTLCLFVDAFPPSPFVKLGVVGWVPTIELTVHVRRRPSPGWVWGEFRCEDLVGGRMVESGALWDASGKLVAQSRQLGLVRS